MKQGNRTERHTSRISTETKLELHRLNKECGISSGDILTNYVQNKSNINAHEIILKLNLLEDHLKVIERVEKEQNKILDYLKEEHKHIKEEIKQLENLKPGTDTVKLDVEENIKSSVRAFFDIRNQHVNNFGMVDVRFDAVKVGRTLCGRYDVNSDVFNKSVELIDDGVDLEDFLDSDLSDYGLI